MKLVEGKVDRRKMENKSQDFSLDPSLQLRQAANGFGPRRIWSLPELILSVNWHKRNSSYLWDPQVRLLRHYQVCLFRVFPESKNSNCGTDSLAYHFIRNWSSPLFSVAPQIFSALSPLSKIEIGSDFAFFAGANDSSFVPSFRAFSFCSRFFALFSSFSFCAFAEIAIC